MLFVLIILVLLSVAAGGAFYYFDKKQKDPSSMIFLDQEQQYPQEQEQEDLSYLGYTRSFNKDIGGHDIKCTRGVTKEFCKTECDENLNCMGFNDVAPGGHWGGESGCCTKSTNTVGLSDLAGIDFYMKNIIPEA